MAPRSVFVLDARMWLLEVEFAGLLLDEFSEAVTYPALKYDLRYFRHQMKWYWSCGRWDGSCRFTTLEGRT